MLEGLCHCGERLREALGGASLLRFTVSPASISNLFLGVGCVFAWLCLVWFLLGLVFFPGFPRFRDQFSSFANTNDRRSCHGAHGMGEKKIVHGASSECG